jgi:putative nucleotidyltransferase with HDIG domain
LRKDIKIPSVEECFQLLAQCHVPKHIIRHCQATAGLAVELAEKIAANGIEVNVDFVHRACLLHDIMRVCDFAKPLEHIFDSPANEEDLQKWREFSERYKGIRHEQAGYEFLKDKYPEIALAIKKHAYKALIEKENCPQTIEEKLVYYADKRAMHDRVVSLAERLEEGHCRNQQANYKNTIDIRYVDSLIFELEKELFRYAGI